MKSKLFTHVFLLGLLVGILAAFSSNLSAQIGVGAGPTTGGSPISGISVTASPASIPVGATAILTAQYVLSGNVQNTNLTNGCLWSSSNPAVATVSYSSGMWIATGVSAGTTSIVCVPAGANPQNLSGSYTLLVAQAPQITNPICSGTCALPQATTNSSYLFTFTASGGSPPYVWMKLSGSFPSGLSLGNSPSCTPSGSTGCNLSGTPTGTGTSTAVVEVTDSLFETQQVTVSLTVASNGTLGAALPQVFVDGNELTCGYGVWPACSTSPASPGLSLTAPGATMTLSLTAAPSWSPSQPAACSFNYLAIIGSGSTNNSYWPANPTPAQLGTGRAQYLADIEACRSLHGIGIQVVRPPGKYVTSGGILIPQTNSVQATTPLVEITTTDATLQSMSAGKLPCFGGVQDNVNDTGATAPGLYNEDCTGQNMYYVNGPSNAADSNGNFGVLSGITTLSVNTITLQSIVHQQNQALALAIVPLYNGFISGVTVKIWNGTSWQSFGAAAGTNCTAPGGAIIGNTLGMCIPGLSGQINIPAGAFVCYNSNVGNCAGSNSGSGSFTLANGTNHNVNDYNYVQYLAQDICTAVGCLPLQFCNPLNTGKNAGQCTGPIAPDHWFLADFSVSFCNPLDPATLGLTNCPGYANGNWLIKTGVSAAQITSPSAQLASDIHLRRFWAHGDWYSLAVGAQSSATPVNLSSLHYSSATDFAVTASIGPGSETHGIYVDGQDVKVANFVSDCCSSGTFAGGFSSTATTPSYLPFTDFQQGRGRETFPYTWLGFQAAQSPGTGKNNGNYSGNAAGQVPDINPYWGGAGDAYPFDSVNITAASYANPSETLTVNSTAGFAIGYIATIAGLLPTGCNGTFPISAIGAGTITVTNTGCGTITNQTGSLTLTASCAGGMLQATCVNVSATGLVTWVSGPSFHDGNSSWAVIGSKAGGKTVLLNDQTGNGFGCTTNGAAAPCKIQSVGSGNCPSFLNSFSGTCPSTITINYSGAALSNIPFILNSPSIVRKNCEESKIGQRLVRYGIICENVDNSGGQSGILQSHSSRQCSGGCAGQNYNTQIANWVDLGYIQRNGCLGPSWDGRSAGVSNGGGVSQVMKFYVGQDILAYNISGSNAGCPSSPAALRIFNAAQSWVGGLVCNGSSCTFTGVASVDLGISLTQATPSGSSTTYATTGSTAANNASLCGNGNPSGTGGYLIVQGFSNSANNSLNLVGFQCTASTGTTLTLSNASGVSDSSGGNAYPVVNVGTSPNYYSSTLGYQTFGMGTGDPVGISNCGTSSLNTSTSSIGPKLASGNSPWAGNANWTVGNALTVTWNSSVNATENDGLCTLTNTQGGPENHQLNHWTVITDACSPIGVGPARNNPSRMLNGLIENSIFVSGTSCSVGSGGYYNTAQLTSPAEGTNSESLNNDTWGTPFSGGTAGGSFSFFYNVFSRPTGAASDYTEFGNNPNYADPGSNACTGTGCNPPNTIYFPATPYCTSGSPSSGCIGFTGLMGTSTLALNMADYHSWALVSGSSYKAGGSYPAADATDMGARIGNIDTYETENPFVCPATCAGPFPE